MADNHYELDQANQKAKFLVGLTRQALNNLALLDAEFAVINTMKDGDGSQASHFQKFVDQYAVEGVDNDAKLATAKKIYDEMNSAQGNSAALRQFVSRLA